MYMSVLFFHKIENMKNRCDFLCYDNLQFVKPVRDAQDFCGRSLIMNLAANQLIPIILLIQANGLFTAC